MSSTLSSTERFMIMINGTLKLTLGYNHALMAWRETYLLAIFQLSRVHVAVALTLALD
jgi:hypothetical protein